MASLPIAFGAATVIATKRRTFTAAATKGSASPPPQEKSLLDFVLGALQKEDQLLETDPLLNKVEGKAAPTSGTRGKSTVAVPAKKKNGGFGIGGLFAKN